MAEKIQMPKLGNSVESCVIVEWLVEEGQQVSEGDTLCVVETDKAAVDVESKFSGTILAVLYKEGDEVPVYETIAIIGEEGESFTLEETGEKDSSREDEEVKAGEVPETAGSGDVRGNKAVSVSPAIGSSSGDSSHGVSPRARNLAERKSVDPLSVNGSGPGGRVIERDIRDVAGISGKNGSSVSPAALAALGSGGVSLPERGSGIGGRILSSDLSASRGGAENRDEGSVKKIPLKGMRRIIADTMLKSITTTAQFTAHSSANAEALLSLRKRFKESPPEMGLNGITINDIITFIVSRTLVEHGSLNSHFDGETVTEFPYVDIGIAVDTPRGLLVPVLRGTEHLSLKQISDRARELYSDIESNSISPDDLSGSTFTITNLGPMGVEMFTPVLNIPETAILGVCSITDKPVNLEGTVKLVPHIGLSLTVNHQVIDGAPAARFLKSLCRNIENADLLMAL